MLLTSDTSLIYNVYDSSRRISTLPLNSIFNAKYALFRTKSQL